MNLAPFHLTRRPFRASPSPDGYIPTPTHDAALRDLRTAIADDAGVALLCGDPGLGKTIAALHLLETLARDITPLFVPTAYFTAPADLHRALLFDLDCPCESLGDQELRHAVAAELFTRTSRGKPTVIVLDEAHRLNADLLEEIHLLDNLTVGSRKMATILLVGLPSLRGNLAVAGQESLAQRASIRPQLEPLNAEQAADYLRAHLLAGGGSAELLTDEAIELLAGAAGGIPRVLNRLAASAFAIAEEAEQDCVDAEAACEALARAGLSHDAPTQPAHPTEMERSAAASAGEPIAGREPVAGRTPKQKARKRRAA